MFPGELNKPLPGESLRKAVCAPQSRRRSRQKKRKIAVLELESEDNGPMQDPCVPMVASIHTPSLQVLYNANVSSEPVVDLDNRNIVTQSRFGK